jgi:hypothetical protein
MSKRFLSKAASLMAVIFLCIGFSVNIFAQAQASTGNVTGLVSDINGAVVPNATVKIKNNTTGLEQTATTNSEGIYNFVLLPPGNYTVSAQAGNFAESKIENVVVNVGRSTDVNITLGASGVSAEVIVTADAIQTTRNESDAVLNETAINSLPINGRRFQDFVTLTPSAQVDPQRGQISLSGQRGINGNINVDGVDYNQSFFGGIRGGERSNLAFTIPQESIKEFQVVAAGYSAEFGRSSGGIVNAVTKSGSNEIHGSLFYLLRHKELAARNDFIDAIEAQPLLAARGIKVIPAPTQQQFGGSIGGPLKENKLFYFLSYEQQRFRASRIVTFKEFPTTVTPDIAEAYNFFRSFETPFVQTNDALAGLGRLDWQINDNNRFNVRYNYSQNKALNAVSTGETALDPTTFRTLGNNGTERNRNNIFVAQLSTIFSPKVANELRFQFAREDRPRFANELKESIAINSAISGSRNFMPTTQFDNRVQFADALTVTAGNHTMKFGGEFSRIYAEQLFGFDQFGSYNVGGSIVTGLQVASLTPGIADRRFDTTGSSYRKQVGNLFAGFSVKEFAVFAQDSWRVRPRFTLNYGLRLEKQFNPDPEISNTTLVNTVRNASFPLLGGRGLDATQIPDSPWQFGPRVGFAWDATGDGKTVVRGFAGLYYARTPLLLIAGPFNNYRTPAGDLRFFTLGVSFTPAQQAAFEAANPQYVAIMNATAAAGQTCNGTTARCLPNTVFRQFAILGINLNNFPLNNLPILTNAQLQTIGNAISAALGTPNNPNSGVAPTSMSPDFENPTSFQYGGGFEREIGPGFVIGLDFAHVKTTKLQRNIDVNLPAPILRDTVTDPAQRPFIGITSGRSRPVTSLGGVQVRVSTGSSVYDAFNFRTRVVRKWGQLNAYYTLSWSKSDDDNERDAGGVTYADPFNLIPEYNWSRLDRRHQFVANPVFFLPWGFEVSSAVRLRSGLPIDVIANSDLNGDGVFTDRPYLVPGVPIKRNSYRNRAIYETDLRVQKSFKFGETRRLILTAEFFNLFNRKNLQLSGSAVTQYCVPSNTRCGLDGITNINFLQIRDQNPASSRFGQYLLNNFLGTIPSLTLQTQLGVRFQF